MGIKSFQGNRIEPEKIQSGNILVADYMSKNLITFKEDQKVIEVMEILVKNGISGGPVVNDNDELVGIISDGDCMKQISESRYFNMPAGDLLVKDYMSKDVATTTPDTSIFDVATQFYQHNCRRFPVIENGKIVGQISRKDILRAALELRAQNWHP